MGWRKTVSCPLLKGCTIKLKTIRTTTNTLNEEREKDRVTIDMLCLERIWGINWLGCIRIGMYPCDKEEIIIKNNNSNNNK